MHDPERKRTVTACLRAVLSFQGSSRRTRVFTDAVAAGVPVLLAVSVASTVGVPALDVEAGMLAWVVVGAALDGPVAAASAGAGTGAPAWGCAAQPPNSRRAARPMMGWLVLTGVSVSGRARCPDARTLILERTCM